MIEPDWMDPARVALGLREVPGPRTNPTILSWLTRLRAWWTDDETPWCGVFVAHCMEKCGVPLPKHWMRAKDWLNWGKPCPPVVGAIAVFGREGGGHVGFLVGQSPGWLHVLGGNQANGVNVMKLASSRLLGTRWPLDRPLVISALPKMGGGVASGNEA